MKKSKTSKKDLIKKSKTLRLPIPKTTIPEKDKVKYPIEIEVKTDLNESPFSICMVKNQFNRYILTIIDCEEIGIKSSIRNTLFNNLLDINFSLKTPDIYHSIDVNVENETYKVFVTVLKDRKSEFNPELKTTYKFYIPNR